MNPVNGGPARPFADHPRGQQQLVGGCPLPGAFCHPDTDDEALFALPQTHGAGTVRDLHSAMQGPGARAAQLRLVVEVFAATTTRDGQLALIDTLIEDWARTSGFHRTLEDYLNARVTLHPPLGMTAAQYRRMVGVLEAFNGSRFYGTIGSDMTTGQMLCWQNGLPCFTICPTAQQSLLLRQAYDALVMSVYQELVLQTRLKPYLDHITLHVADDGVHFDGRALEASFNRRFAAAPRQAIEDLIEFDCFMGASLRAVGLRPTAALRGWLRSIAPGDPLQTLLSQLGAGTADVGV